MHALNDHFIKVPSPYIGIKMDISNKDKASVPFSREYVLRTTAKHMLKSVDISIEKTMARVPEFEGDSAKSTEILTTLSDLHALKARINLNPV
jgi:hypothetical protein